MTFTIVQPTTGSRLRLWVASIMAAAAFCLSAGDNDSNDSTDTKPDDTFVRGADISWCTEMEADGMRFYDAEGKETDVFKLMKDCGMNAIRLRVWVNPSRYGYGAWCDKADVVAKAKRAVAAGMDVMINFHYSDFFADPARQYKPLDWEADTTAAQVAEDVRAHTLDVLNALKDAGVTPKWVQVGNETRHGMVWDIGKVGGTHFSDYVTLHNAGYDAVKEVFPDAIVIVHLNSAYDTSSLKWFFNGFTKAGGKSDMIGLSHYPGTNNWDSEDKGTPSNKNAIANIQTVIKRFGKPVMIVETGFDATKPEQGKAALQDLFERARQVDGCTGIVFWEPEVYGGWKPKFYNRLNWISYGMGAFTPDGRPTEALEPFKEEF